MNNRGMFNIISTIIVILVVGFLVFYFVNKDDNSDATTNTENIGANIANEAVLGAGNVIHITDDGFSPKEVTIKKGETITWKNDGTKASWPASAMHPTHTVYPEADYEAEGSYMGSKACVSEGEAKDGAFDPCKGIEPGQEWSFTFNQTGSWGFHDHLNARHTGKITVTE